VIIISNVAYKDFVLRSGGTLTEHVVAHSILFLPFPLGGERMKEPVCFLGLPVVLAGVPEMQCL